MHLTEFQQQWGNTTSMIARLKPGVTVDNAQAELDLIVAGLKEAQLRSHYSPHTRRSSLPASHATEVRR
jgi:hypothetical protein